MAKHSHSHKSKLWLKTRGNKAAVCMELGTHAIYHELSYADARATALFLLRFANEERVKPVGMGSLFEQKDTE